MADDTGTQGTLTSPSARNPTAAAPGRGTQLDRYVILERVGEGGMGVVFSAYDSDLDRKVALKLLRREGSNRARARLLSEAKSMARLTHPNVVTVYNVGSSAGRDYIAMEFVDGPTLSNWIKVGRRKVEAGALAASNMAREAIELFVSAGRGLAAAHRMGVIHRDFKPSNVLINDEGRAMVTDFGVAQHPDDEEEKVDTDDEPPPLVGTPAYMAPEQFDGQTDELSDQFSFCVSLYEALYGKRPFRGSDADTLRESFAKNSLANEPPSASAPKRVWPILKRGLSINPADRFTDMDALLAALTRAPVKRSRLTISAVGLAAVAAGAVLWTSAGSSSAADRCADPADSLAGVWDNNSRAKVRQAFEATGLPYAGESYMRTAATLDRYTEAWSATYNNSCQSTYIERTQAEAVHALRLGCLQDRLGQLRSLVRLLEAADTPVVDQVAKTIATLDSIDECSDVAALEKGIKPPQGSEARDRVTQLRSELGEVRALLDLGQPERAIATASRVLEEARELRYQPLIAEAALQVGLGHSAVDHITDAHRFLEEAELVAEEAGYTEVRARALVAAAAMVARSSSVLSDIDRAERRARAALALTSGTADLEARLLRAGALAKAAANDLDAAIALLLRAEALYEGILRDPERASEHTRARLDLSDTLVKRAHLLHASQRPNEALIAIERALGLAVAEVGPGHPLSIGPLEARSYALREVGRFDEARAIGREVRAFYNTPRGRELLRQSPQGQGEFAPPTGARRVRGSIVDRQGKPVAGARIVVATMIIGDARFATTHIDVKEELKTGRIELRSDENGEFEIPAAPTPGVLVAEANGTGRSMPMRLETGDSELQIRVELRPFGSLRGRLTERPNKRVLVQAFPRPIGPRPIYVIIGHVRSDGTYEFERLAEGDYEIKFGTATSSTVAVDGRKLHVAADRVTEADLSLSVGQISLEVEVNKADGASARSTQIALLDGRIRAKTAGELTALALAGNNLRVAFQTQDGRPARVDNIKAGLYTLCAIPLAGDHRNPEFIKELGPVTEKLRAYCETFELDDQERLQQRQLVVPRSR